MPRRRIYDKENSDIDSAGIAGSLYRLCTDSARISIEEYTRIIQHNPNDADAYNNRGVAHLDSNNIDYAIADFEAALRINPNYANARQGLELARQIQGQ